MRRLLLLGSLLTAFAVGACGYADPYAAGGPVANESPNPSASPNVTPGVDDFGTCNNLNGVTYPDGLKLMDVKVGTGTVAKSGQNADVNYTGWTTDGKAFDSSRFAGRTPFEFQIGQQQVIAGWDEGVPGMQVGGKRCLKIPPELGYGANGQQDQTTGQYIIPPNATLVFEIELLSVKPGPTPKPSPSPSPSPSASPSASPTPSA
ncbi:MAG TPA: FKBP-type peptidyl-prolyl cis-trans isomerase [Candidatus Dormibacteraeota bacterium]